MAQATVTVPPSPTSPILNPMRPKGKIPGASPGGSMLVGSSSNTPAERNSIVPSAGPPLTALPCCTNKAVTVLSESMVTVVDAVSESATSPSQQKNCQFVSAV